MDRYYRHTHANVHRGVHTLSEEATAQYEGARAKVSDFIGACCPKEVIWTRNATEAINLVAYSWGRANLKAGDHILLTEMEHHANLVPWQILAAERGVQLDFVPVADNGTLILDNLDRLLTPRTKLFAFTAASNVLGTINPVQRVDGCGAQNRRTGPVGCVPERAPHAGECTSPGHRFHGVLGP